MPITTYPDTNATITAAATASLDLITKTDIETLLAQTVDELQLMNLYLTLLMDTDLRGT